MQQYSNTPAVNGQRMWQSLMDLAQIGATEKGGNCRLALTELDGKGRDLLVSWMEQAGLKISVDQIGNIFGRREGRNSTLPPIVTGSHIDTQPTGGKFDGCYGVLAGLEVMRILNDNDVVTEAPLELAIWTNEEGSRFVPVMMGSGVFAGKFPLETALNARDQQGKSVRDELRAIGYAGQAPVGERPIGAYFEAHIEQGPILEKEQTVIGVVTGSLGVRWYDVTVKGMEMHAGPTPMAVRQDALFVATHLMQQVIHLANANQPHGRGTVGVVQVHPGSRNVIPGEVSFTVDLRHQDVAVLSDMDARWREACVTVQKEFGLTVTLKDVQYFPPTPFETRLVNQVRASAAVAGFTHMDIVTGAGHDAVYIAAVAPTAMIFVPCKDGVSHNEIEDAQPEHLAAGCQVLLGAMLASAGVTA
ncbi:Zn-dependent hydrolase [Undibacterium rugosum]|uniref:Zn-dependent hydrolase n=1 Tax=Undibacterium rugosum TaxID=2762291 RepID=A0A923KTC7_9BURK|nr:Zn-dependent hydrolase [Undibacterium rugosum]MBC3935899.1 Zn-dependent hydrolase [Undibacterium rugosum]MBR7779318.1 Zn-dependent hydrolase [Undibacterium rugosum]